MSGRKMVQRRMKVLGLKCVVRLKKYRSYKGQAGKIHYFLSDFWGQITDYLACYFFFGFRYPLRERGRRVYFAIPRLQFHSALASISSKSALYFFPYTSYIGCTFLINASLSSTYVIFPPEATKRFRFPSSSLYHNSRWYKEESKAACRISSWSSVENSSRIFLFITIISGILVCSSITRLGAIRLCPVLM